jgi:hypothetical protein
MARTPDGDRIAEPGEPTDKDLASLLGVDDRSEQSRQLRQDLEAIRDAERRAERETEGIRLH